MTHVLSHQSQEIFQGQLHTTCSTVSSKQSGSSDTCVHAHPTQVERPACYRDTAVYSCMHHYSCSTPHSAHNSHRQYHVHEIVRLTIILTQQQYVGESRQSHPVCGLLQPHYRASSLVLDIPFCRHPAAEYPSGVEDKSHNMTSTVTIQTT